MRVLATMLVACITAKGTRGARRCREIANHRGQSGREFWRAGTPAPAQKELISSRGVKLSQKSGHRISSIGMEQGKQPAISSSNLGDGNRPATKIRIIEDAEATGATAAAYDFWRAGSGRKQVPGIIKCFGARPDFLRQVIEFSNTVHFSEGHLTRRHKEMIASHVSFLNRCPY